MQDTRGWKGKRLRYGAATIGAVAVIVSWGTQPLVGQSLGLTSGRVLPGCLVRPDTQLWVQARNIPQGEIVATSEVDENTGEYELESLPEGSYLLELIDEKGKLVCTEGPVRITAARVLYAGVNIGPDDASRWWVPFLAAAAAGTTTGVIVGGSSPAQPICHEGGTVTVEDDELPGHLSHGDSLGACPASPSR